MAMYSVTVILSTTTLNQLTNSGYRLCCLLAAEVGDLSALPLLWNTSSYASHTLVSWPTQCAVFTSVSTLVAGRPVQAGWSTALAAGQLLTVQASGSGAVSNQGIADCLSIYNAAQHEQLCGLMANDLPFCALPLPGLTGQVMAAVPKILLLFADGTIPPLGTAINQWPGGRTSGLLVDASQGSNPTVSFDIATGWDWGQQAWGTAVPFTAELPAYLVTQSASLSQQNDLLMQRLALA